MEKYIKTRTRLVRLTTNDTTLIKSKLRFVKIINKITELGFKDGYYNFSVNYTYYSPIKYEALVNQLVKERYSDSEEFAILRKAISNGISEEYTTYNAYVEECKTQAKAFIEERNKVLGV